MKKGLFLLYLILGAIIILSGFYAYNQHRLRPGIAPDILEKSIFREENTVCQIDGVSLSVEGKNVKQQQIKEIEFILSQKSIGDTVSIYVQSESDSIRLETRLQPFYDYAPVPFINLVIGLICAGTGFLVFFRRPQSRKARVYYWATLAFYFTLCVTEGFYILGKEWFTSLPGVLYYVAYAFLPALFLHFAFQYTPLNWRIRRLPAYWIIYTPACLFAILLVWCFSRSALHGSIEKYRMFLKILYVFRIYVILFLSFSVGHFIRLYRLIFLEEQRVRIKWTLFGLVIGLVPFVLLFQLPIVFKLDPLINQDWSNVFLVFIPITLAISILKYKLFNIEFVIKKSLIYATLTVFTVSVYLIFVKFFQSWIAQWFAVKNEVSFGLSALAAASTIHPARKKIQELIDKSFYRISYDYKKSILSFIEAAQKMVDSGRLLDFLILKIQETLPLDRLDVAVVERKESEWRILFQSGNIDGMDSFVELKQNRNVIYAKKSSVRTEIGMDFSQEKFLSDSRLEAVLPLSFRMADISGCMLLGKKKSGERYSIEDLELLRTLAHEFSLNLERIRLQETVYAEKAEKAKLEEVNQMKTEFISTVSHEIRTPMSSIHGLSELLRSGKVSDNEKKEELLGLITSECERLSRFLHNILDFGRIERDVKQYNFERTEIQSLVRETLALFESRLKSGGFVLKTTFPENSVLLNMDRDAVKQSLTNIIDNAIKYSKKHKEIEVLILEKKDRIEVQVKDKGIGIRKEEQLKIFKDFYRVPEMTRQCPEGVGLGLKIVKHIMEAHNGEVLVKSEYERGSTFSLVFKRS